MPVACLPPPWVDFFFQFMSGFVRRFCPFTVTQDQGQAQSLRVVMLGSCFPIPSVCCATLVVSTDPMGSRAYSFRVFWPHCQYYAFVLVLSILCSLNIDDICARQSYVQVYTVAAFEDHCLVLSFGGLAV